MTTAAQLAECLRAPPLPFPASGRTLGRWRVLADVAENSLTLAKWFEAHTDALAILHELGEPANEVVYGVFAAEGPTPLLARENRHGVVLEGKKPWCSGADVVDAALVSCIDECGNRRLAEVSFHQPSVVLSPSTWAAEGMRGARTVEATFTDAPARLIGGPSAYLDRPGFWQGAVGIAACWYGGARGVARHLRRACARRADSHALAHLGVVDRSLQAAAAALREAARYVDAHPTANVQRLALAVRDLIEDVVHEVVARTDRALGPGPRATDVEYATRVEDLTVFVRQNHAERDRETLGRLCLDSLDDRWNLDAHDL